MGTPVSELLESYTALASSLYDRWSTLASRAASRLDAGAYDSASAEQDALAGATLAAEGARLWADWMFEALTQCIGGESEPNVVEASFDSPLAGACLELEGALLRGPGPEALPASAVSVDPKQLEPGHTKFTLCADATGYHGGTYIGKVNATTDTGETRALTVWIVVP